MQDCFRPAYYRFLLPARCFYDRKTAQFLIFLTFRFAPQTFQIVEFPFLFQEDVHHY